VPSLAAQAALRPSLGLTFNPYSAQGRGRFRALLFLDKRALPEWHFGYRTTSHPSDRSPLELRSPRTCGACDFAPHESSVVHEVVVDERQHAHPLREPVLVRGRLG